MSTPVYLCALALAALASSAVARAPADDPYAFDPGFRNGVAAVDRFGGNNADNRDNHGSKVATLADGSVVVASLVQKIGASANQANGFYNLGLVRYTTSGQKIAWTNVDPAYTDSSKNYIVYPNTDTTAREVAVVDIREYQNQIYVLTERSIAGTDTDVQIRRFGLDGAFLGNTWVFNATNPETGAGMVFWRDGESGPYKLIVAGTRSTSAGDTVYLARFTLDQAGAPQLDSGTFGIGGYLDRKVVRCEDDAHGPMTCPTTAKAVTASYGVLAHAFGDATNGARPNVYVLGDFPRKLAGQPANRDLMVMKLDADGVRQGGFGNEATDGVITLGFDAVGSNLSDVARAITAKTYTTNQGALVFDHINVVAAVSQHCGTGVGFASMDERNHQFAKKVFGGSSMLSGVCMQDLHDDPAGMAWINASRVAVVGRSWMSGGTTEVVASPFMALLDERPNPPTLTEYRKHPILNAGGVRVGNAAFNGVSVSSNSTLTAVGDVQDSGNNQKYMVVTARLASDRIFGDDMD